MKRHRHPFRDAAPRERRADERWCRSCWHAEHFWACRTCGQQCDLFRALRAAIVLLPCAFAAIAWRAWQPDGLGRLANDVGAAVVVAATAAVAWFIVWGLTWALRARHAERFKVDVAASDTATSCTTEASDDSEFVERTRRDPRSGPRAHAD